MTPEQMKQLLNTLTHHHEEALSFKNRSTEEQFKRDLKNIDELIELRKKEIELLKEIRSSLRLHHHCPE